MADKRSVGILIFPEVEVLDFCGPFEVFASARAVGGTDRFFNVKENAIVHTSARATAPLPR